MSMVFAITSSDVLLSSFLSLLINLVYATFTTVLALGIFLDIGSVRFYDHQFYRGD